jgi:hypothetical protein
MKRNERCEKTRLAECGAFSVDLCECSVVSLALGFVTMRLEKAAFAELAAAIRAGLDALSRAEPTLH